MAKGLVYGAATLTLLMQASCMKPVKSESTGGRYTDPYTCEIKNRKETDSPYDPDCIKAAQAAAEAYAKASRKK